MTTKLCYLCGSPQDINGKCLGCSMIGTGMIYTPYIPLQITSIRCDEKDTVLKQSEKDELYDLWSYLDRNFPEVYRCSRAAMKMRGYKYTEKDITDNTSSVKKSLQRVHDKWYIFFGFKKQGYDNWQMIQQEFDTEDNAFAVLNDHLISYKTSILLPNYLYSINISRKRTVIENGQEEEYLDIYLPKVRLEEVSKIIEWNKSLFTFHSWRANRKRKWSWLLGEY